MKNIHHIIMAVMSFIVFAFALIVVMQAKGEDYDDADETERVMVAKEATVVNPLETHPPSEGKEDDNCPPDCPPETENTTVCLPASQQQQYVHRQRQMVLQRADETPASVAAAYDVEEEVVYRYNPDLQRGKPIPAGSQVNLPPPPSNSRPQFVPQRQETLTSLAQAHGVTEEELLRVNPGLQRGQPIPKGQTVYLPSTQGKHQQDSGSLQGPPPAQASQPREVKKDSEEGWAVEVPLPHDHSVQHTQSRTIQTPPEDEKEDDEVREKERQRKTEVCEEKAWEQERQRKIEGEKARSEQRQRKKEEEKAREETKKISDTLSMIIAPGPKDGHLIYFESTSPDTTVVSVDFSASENLTVTACAGMQLFDTDRVNGEIERGGRVPFATLAVKDFSKGSYSLQYSMSQREARPKREAEGERKREEEKAQTKDQPRKKVDSKAQEAKGEEEMNRKLNEEDVRRRRAIWADLKAGLPTEKKDKEQRRQRFDLFKEFDRGGKKFLTPEDLDHGCQTALGLGQLKKGLAFILPKAHANARAVHQVKGKAKQQSEANVERCEFRLVFVHIKQLFDLWFMFDTMDVANTGFISEAEFETGVEQLKVWGKEVHDPKAEFAAVDTAGSGKISFAEFCDFAQANSLESKDEGDEADTDIDEEPETEDAEEARTRKKRLVERRKKNWEGLAHRLPTNKKSKEERLRRFAYHREFDTDGKGFLTFADVEAGCETVLGLGQLGKGLRHVLPLAFNSARGAANVKGQVTDSSQHVEKTEMRLLFVYIHQYFDLWFLFDTLDVDSGGDISFEEFAKGVPEVEAWAGVKIEDPKAEFEAADTGKTGEVTFVEFCEWAHHKNTKEV